MEAVRRERIIKQLSEVIDTLVKERPTAYDRCVDLTEKLFYKHDRVVLVMNHKDFMDLCHIWHQSYDIKFPLMIVRDFQTPHGVPIYTIVDQDVERMYGFIRED